MLTAKLSSVDEACADIAIGAYCTTVVFTGVSKGSCEACGGSVQAKGYLITSTYFACHVELFMSLVFL